MKMKMEKMNNSRLFLFMGFSLRPFSNTSTVRKFVITARILQLIHQLCLKGIHVTKRDIFYTDVKLFQDQIQSDIKIGKDMLEEGFVKKNPGWVEELTLMVKTKQKAEIQALSTFGFENLCEVYLPLKLQVKDWLCVV